MDVDRNLEALQVQLQRVLPPSDEVARLQNRWSEVAAEVGADRCSPEARDLREQARVVGTRLRNDVVQARRLLDVLRADLAASTVAPVLDPTRRQAAFGAEEAVTRSTHAFLAAVRFQEEQIEWRSRRCG